MALQDWTSNCPNSNRLTRSTVGRSAPQRSGVPQMAPSVPRFPAELSQFHAIFAFEKKETAMQISQLDLLSLGMIVVESHFMTAVCFNPSEQRVMARSLGRSAILSPSSVAP
jgi:hypothetical protein